MYLVTMKLKNGDEVLYVAEGKTGDIAIVRARRTLKASSQKADVTDISARDLGGMAYAVSDLLVLALERLERGIIVVAESSEGGNDEDEG